MLAQGEAVKEADTVPEGAAKDEKSEEARKDEPILRRPNLGPAKLEAEGKHAEVQTVLGWEVDARE